jgi:hypothetical protein
VLAVTSPSAFRVSDCLPARCYILTVEALLVAIAAIGGDYLQIYALLLRACEHLFEGRCCHGAHLHVCSAWVGERHVRHRQIRRYIVCWLQRVLLIHNNPDAGGCGERVLLFIEPARVC